ncbi:MAG: DNA topoisomerase, partial [Candidatus Pacebacteria bacterium]|nr:DNA topoisomerase [Candidatus Paceibacterota bacterium]
IMEREREIRAFNSHTFWIITADTETAKKDKLPLTCVEEPTDKQEVERILEVGKKEKWVVQGVAETEAKRSPRAPFITSTLQQSASSRLGFSPSRTMRVAQRLYEAGHITYMRTDSTNLSATAMEGIQKAIEKKFGKELFSPRTYSKKSKNAQEAHEAIRPSHLEHESEGLNEEQQKLYRLIWRRTVASQMADAKILRTKITVKINSIPDFVANGSRVLSPGWLLADPAARGEDVEVQKVVAGDVLDLKEMHTEEKQTEPPPRYSEAGLVKELEKRGIGRPSTYASIIKTLEDRGYVEKIQKALCPTDTGDVVSSFLEKNFGDYISDSFTAKMEDELDDIATGKETYKKMLTDFYKPFLKDLKAKDKLDKVTNLGDAPPEFKCPKCGSPMVIKLSKTGKFMSCSKFPDCLGARNMEGKELEGPKETGEICPDCGGKLVLREGRFGQFISCANYPKCKYIKKDAELERKNSTGVQCPICKEGMMTERKGRFGLFYSCSNYPKCKHIIKSKPTGNICKLCGSLMMIGTKTIPERCSSKICPNNRPDKLQK